MKVVLNTKKSNKIKSKYIYWKGIHIINNYLTSFLKLEADCAPWEASWILYMLCCSLRTLFSLSVNPLFKAETSTQPMVTTMMSRSILIVWTQVNNLLSKNGYDQKLLYIILYLYASSHLNINQWKQLIQFIAFYAWFNIHFIPLLYYANDIVPSLWRTHLNVMRNGNSKPRRNHCL